MRENILLHPCIVEMAISTEANRQSEEDWNNGRQDCVDYYTKEEEYSIVDCYLFEAKKRLEKLN